MTTPEFFGSAPDRQRSRTPQICIYKERILAIKRCKTRLAAKVLENYFNREHDVNHLAGLKAKATKKACEREELEYTKSIQARR